MEATLKKPIFIWVKNHNYGKTVKLGARALIFLKMLVPNLKSTQFSAILITLSKKWRNKRPLNTPASTVPTISGTQHPIICQEFYKKLWL